MKKVLLSVFCLGLLVSAPACKKKDKTEKSAQKADKKAKKQAKKADKKTKKNIKKYINVDDIIIYDIDEGSIDETDSDAPMKF